MNVFIRTNASQQLGSGHVMRCLTLANELRRKGHVSFICYELHENMCDYIEQQGYLVPERKRDFSFRHYIPDRCIKNFSDIFISCCGNQLRSAAKSRAADD